ncbi:BamA/TamA family outer membrane protein [Sandarakinorhabdus sp. AAP62]|uniref:autotransporter assembly complex protein TamA n=1 Tax=Sandarakinorhabdus sp. AAP62 TaxID=1248916 RepID=UPI00187D3FA8|nr:BamA/TamA family outer membrane protein [Sandarakinorhabdus sp. AAP62]
MHRLLPLLLVAAAGTAQAQTAPAAEPLPMPPPATDAIPGPESPLPDLPDSDAVAWPDVESTTGAADAPDAAVRYSVEVSGLAELGLDDEFRSLSALWLHRGEETNLAQLGRRIAEDRDLADLLLRSIGHYGGQARISIEPAQAGRPSIVRVRATPGPIYNFREISITAPIGALGPDPARIVGRLLPIRVGDAVEAARVQSAQDGLPIRLADAGYPFARIAPPDITIDHASRDATLVQSVDLGRRGVFGAIRIDDGVKGMDEKHVGLLARFKPGDRYSNAGREDLRRALVQTGLFGAVAIKPGEGEVREDGTQTVDLEISSEAAPMRTIALAGGFSTGQGVRAEGSWTHRNLFPPEGAFTARAVAAEREQVAQVELRKRNFGQRDRQLLVTGGFTASQQFAFAAETLGISAALARESNILWQKDWTWSIGAQALITSQRDRSVRGDPRRTFTVLALPASITWDRSDDLLNPSRGFRLTTRLSPEFTLRNQSNFNYLKAQFEATAYKPFGDSLVLAGRFHLGSIVGANRGVIAPDRRFYAGGGGSVRGYVFQGVGPRNEDNVPTGGNSLTELAVEARYRFQALGQDLGIVAFVDAGEVSSGTTPAFDRLSLGAGIGARFYTGFGPVRVDIATPVNPQQGDPRLVFYVSIGQAF